MRRRATSRTAQESRRLLVLGDRARALLPLLGGTDPDLGAADPVEALVGRLPTASPDETWLTVAVLTGRLPTTPQTVSAVRLLRADGPHALVARLTAELDPDVGVEIESTRVVVDTSRTVAATDEFGAGVITSRLIAEWDDRPDAVLVERTSAGDGLVEARRSTSPVLSGTGPGSPPGPRVVPWRVPVIVLGAPTDADAASRLQSLAMHGASSTGGVGFGEPAISCNDRTPGEAAGAAHALSALRHFTRLVAISATAAEEYEGWKEMVGTLDLPGPTVVAVELPDELPRTSTDSYAVVHSLAAEPLPLVVSTGGLGGRGNQLLVLRAANTLWRAGLSFQLAIVGYGTDIPAVLEQQVRRLCEAGHPVVVVPGGDGGNVVALVEKARCLVDVPQYDPIGLHQLLAEALGAPVVCGSPGRSPVTVEHGVVTDPDDSTSLAQAIRPLLEADQPVGRARRRPTTTWRAFADEMWQRLAGPGLHAGADAAASSTPTLDGGASVNELHPVPHL